MFDFPTFVSLPWLFSTCQFCFTSPLVLAFYFAAREVTSVWRGHKVWMQHVQSRNTYRWQKFNPGVE